MSQARDFADSFSAVSTGRRNLIINGDMEVAQRGTSKTGITSSGYTTVDRIAHNHDYPTGVTSIATSQDSDAPSGFTNCFKIEPEQARTAALASADRLFVTYKMEAQNLTHLDYGSSDAKTLTVSFWVKSNLTGIVTVEINSPDSGSSYQYYHETITINAADTWEYKTFQILGNTNGAINNDNGIGLQMGLHVASGPTFTSGTFSTGSWHDTTAGNRSSPSNIDIYSSTSNYFKITGIQIEVGNSASPFEHRSYGEELTLCKRYFNRIQETGGSAYNWGFPIAGASQVFRRLNYIYPVEMRVNPTLLNAVVGTGGGGSLTDATVESGNTRSTVINLDLDTASDTAYCWIQTGDLNAEL